MEFKHTEGPWFVVDNPPNNNGSTDTSIYGGRGVYVADVYYGYVGSEGISKVEAIANAHLIAAAPDLLEALQYALPYLERGELGMARVAIAKATGAKS